MSQVPGQAAGESFDSATRSVMPSQRVLRLHLLRHGAVQELEQRGVRGQLDVPLSEEGERQTAALVQWMVQSEAKPDQLWGSDLQRCRVQGEQLAQAWGMEYREDPRLREQHMGAWQGLPWGEISARYGSLINDYWDDYVNTRPPEGESLQDLANRVLAWWAELCDQEGDQRLCVVTHVGVIRSLTSSLLGLPMDQALRLAPATASHTSMLISDAGAVLSTFGERPWTFNGSADGPPTGAPA